MLFFKALIYLFITPFRPFWSADKLRQQNNLTTLNLIGLGIVISIWLAVLLYVRVLTDPNYRGRSIFFEANNFTLLTYLFGPIGVAFFVRVLINKFGYAYMESKEIFTIALFSLFPQVVATICFLYLYFDEIHSHIPQQQIESVDYIIYAGIAWTLLTIALLTKRFKKIKLGTSIFIALASATLYALSTSVLIGKLLNAFK